MRRLLVDVTRTLESGLHTGIQRVVRRLWGALNTLGPAMNLEVVAVVFEGAEWYGLDYLPPHTLEFLPSAEAASAIWAARMHRKLKLEQGDVLLLADASWYADPWPAVATALTGGARLAGFVHDVLPLQQPQWFRPELPARFATHLQAMVCAATVLLVPSEVVRAGLRPYLAATLGNQVHWPPVFCLPLGGDFLMQPAAEPTALPAPLTPHTPYALMVGTVEPRKNHGLVLQAFAQLWAQGDPLQLVLVGAPGWCAQTLLDELDGHAQRGRLLHWFSHLSDAALHAVYGSARTLVMASLDEGFGLPMVEATFVGCPVLASDIAVLHEVGDGWARFLPPDKVAPWVQALTCPRALSCAHTTVRTWATVAQDLIFFLRSSP